MVDRFAGKKQTSRVSLCRSKGAGTPLAPKLETIVGCKMLGGQSDKYRIIKLIRAVLRVLAHCARSRRRGRSKASTYNACAIVTSVGP